MRYYRRAERRFEWKFEAKEFIKGLKKKAKKAKLKIVVKLEPLTKFTSSVRFSESRVVGYVVEWYYKP